MSSTAAVAPMRGTHLNGNNIVRSRGMSTSSHGGSASGSPKPVFDMMRDGWVSSFDEEGNFLEVSFEASPDNESVLLMGGSASEAELNQHFFPRMSIGTNALSSMAPPRISTLLKNPISTFKNPISRFKKKTTEETGNFEKQEESVHVSSGKKRRRNKKLSKSISKMASKVVHSKRTSAAPPNAEQAPRETNKAPSKTTRGAKELKKKIMQRLSKKGPLLRMNKIGRKSSAEGAFPSVARKEHWDASSVDSSADSIRPRELDKVIELGVASSMDRQHNKEVPANTTDETSDTSCADSTEEVFTPNMAETTILYHDQRIPVKWGVKDAAGDNQKKSLALDLGEPTDESRNNKASTDGDESNSENFNGVPMQEQLNIFDADETLSCDVEELMNKILEEGESRHCSHSACARTDCAEFADLKILGSNSAGGMASPREWRGDSMSAASTVTNLSISPTSTTAPVFTPAQFTTPLKTIVIRKTRVDQTPPKSPKPMRSDTKKPPPPRSPARRTSSASANKNGSASKKQFNYRANRTAALFPTRLQMDQAPSSPIGDLVRKPRRRHSLQKTIKRGIRSHPVVSITVALSAALFFIRNIVQL